jgi:tripartite-type tricarboxylate transporter receptor subunit TctC
VRLLILAAAALAAGVLDFRGARADDFYRGKTVTLFASQPPGGGIDTEMRLVARFLGKFIPDEPSILPMNMRRLSAARLCARQPAGKRGAIVPA